MAEHRLIGWREWVELPELGVGSVKAKVDTGARTSALHAFDLEPFRRGGAPWIGFRLHPLQRDTETVVACEAAVVDSRDVRDSGGHGERRHVIETLVRIGETGFRAEVTLTGRDDMLFRMLLGRTAIRGRFLVDAGRSYVAGALGPHARVG